MGSGLGCWSLAVVGPGGDGCCCVWLFLKERSLEKRETMVAVVGIDGDDFNGGCRIAVYWTAGRGLRSMWFD
jgi:hypothetical protein